MCIDSETATGARIWNHANVLVLSIRCMSIPMAKETLDAWFATPLSLDNWNLEQIAYLHDIEAQSDESSSCDDT